MKKIEFISCFVLLVFALGCAKDEVKKDSVRPVKLTRPILQDSLNTIEVSGLIVEDKEANISFRIPGYIKEIKVIEGQFVKKDEVLVKLDNKDYYHKFNAVKAEYERVTEAAERIISLYEKNSVSKSDYDKAIAGKSQITAKFEAEKNNLSYTELKAPFTGYINDIVFKEGEIVDAGMSVISLISNMSLDVEVNISAELFSKREQFKEFYLRTENNNDKIKLDLKSILMKGNNNQLYKVVFGLDNKLQNYAAGMAADVTICYKEDINTRIKIPYRSILRENDKNFVWVYNENNSSAIKREIDISEVDGNGMILVNSGIKLNELIIKSGINNLKENMIVKPLELPSKSNFGGLL